MSKVTAAPPAGPILDEALRLSLLGVPVHWLHPPELAQCPRRESPCEGPCKCAGKSPVGAWKRRHYQGPIELRRTYRAGYNLGIKTGWVPGATFCFVVVDLDSAEALEWAQRSLPWSSVRTVTTKGEHWYYLHPGPTVVIGNRGHRQGLAFDLRGDGGQVVCAPSIHPVSRSPYRAAGAWTVEGFRSLPVFQPAWLPKPPPPGSGGVPPLLSVPRDTRTRARARGYVRRFEVHPRGEGQGTATFKLAAILLNNFGMSAGEAFELLRAEYSPRCPQPYSDAELLRKVTEAAEKRRTRSAPSAWEVRS